VRAVIQRVTSANVIVDGELISEIGPGLLTLLGIRDGDTKAEVDWIIEKITALRVFDDAEGRMNLSLKDIGGQHLIVSQFTLWGETKKGNRPSYSTAAKAEIARPLYEYALEKSQGCGVPTKGGRFQAHMRVSLENDGPVTLIIES